MWDDSPIPVHDSIDEEFEGLYQEFRAHGGLDQTRGILDEDAERTIRLASYCKHGLIPRRCSNCAPIFKHNPNQYGLPS